MPKQIRVIFIFTFLTQASQKGSFRTQNSVLFRGRLLKIINYIRKFQFAQKQLQKLVHLRTYLESDCIRNPAQKC